MAALRKRFPPTFTGLGARWMSIGAPPRIAGIDVARGLAVIGMIGAHVAAVGEEIQLGDPTTWVGVIHGRSAILFGVVAGVSLALLSGRTVPAPEEIPALRLRLLGRGLAIFAIGLVLELLGTPLAIILTLYGFLFFLAPVFIAWRSRTLIIVGAAIAVIGPTVLALIERVSYGGPGSQLVFGVYPLTAWIPFAFAGLVLGRQHLDRLGTAALLLPIGAGAALLGYGIDAAGRAGVLGPVVAHALALDPYAASTAVGSTSAAVGSAGASDATAIEPVDGLATLSPGDTVIRALLDTSPHTGSTLEIVASGGFALAVIALCLLLTRIARPVLVPLIALGSMPLTAYSAHAVWVGVLQLVAADELVLGDHAVWAAMVGAIGLAALVWALFFTQGPLEWLTSSAARAMARGAPRAASGRGQ